MKQTKKNAAMLRLPSHTSPQNKQSSKAKIFQYNPHNNQSAPQKNSEPGSNGWVTLGDGTKDDEIYLN